MKIDEDKELDDILAQNTILCIGVDKKIHMCVSWDVRCLCGVGVLIKNPPDCMIVNRFSCYECTY